MNIPRRDFIRTSTATLGASCLSFPIKVQPQDEVYSTLDKVIHKPVLKKHYFPDSVVVKKLDLLYYDDNFICRVMAESGAEGYSVSNNAQMKSLYPIFIHRLQDFFIGKDLREWELLLDQVYVYQSNYKLQNLALWVPLATIEFAVLDLLGKIAGRPIGALIGEIHHPEIAVYQANNYRGKSAEESLELIRQQIESSKAHAIKCKIGGRMSKNKDFPPGRTERLIPMLRKEFGSELTIYADSNGSYDVKEAIRIGKILEEHNIAFYEEPVPFDWYVETKEVADGLEIPIAGGEQEPSMHNFRFLIANQALQVLQPDIFYFGGMIRSMKVARMAEAMGLICTPHISGSGLGYLYMMHFVSVVRNAGPYHEFKGFNESLPFSSGDGKMKIINGKVKVPSGPGLGIDLDPDFIKKHKVISKL